MAENTVTSIIIREIGLGDLDEFCRTRLQALIDFPRSFWETADEFRAKSMEEHAKRLAENVDSANKFILGAFDGGGKLIGTVGFNRDTGVKGRHRGMIWGMYVQSTQQGRGIGKALLEKAIERTRTMDDIEVLFLFVAPENAPARRLYTAVGFKTYGIEPYSMKVDGTYYDEEMMYLKL